MDSLVRVLVELEGRLKSRLITGELEIICWLYAHGPTSSRALSERTKVSNANYQMILRRLKDEGVLVVQAGDGDRRVREYDLSPHVREQIDITLNGTLNGGPCAAPMLVPSFQPWADSVKIGNHL